MIKFRKNIPKMAERQCGIFFEVNPDTGRIVSQSIIADDFESEVVVALTLDKIERAIERLWAGNERKNDHNAP